MDCLFVSVCVRGLGGVLTSAGNVIDAASEFPLVCPCMRARCGFVDLCALLRREWAKKGRMLVVRVHACERAGMCVSTYFSEMDRRVMLDLCLMMMAGHVILDKSLVK